MTSQYSVDYRNAAGIAHDLGTAVNIQTMVFGNLGEGSGTGVVTTRNVTTGEHAIEGDYLTNAQGADEVATQLLAQVVDVHLDRVALHLLAPAVELLLELLARQHAAGGQQQRMQQVELARRQRHGLAVLRDAARGRRRCNALPVR